LNPTLFIIAGPNGSGKSFFSDSYLKQNGFNLTSFDYDLEFEMRWKKFSYDPYIEDGVRSATSEFFEESYELALKAKQDFAYQTNYHSDQHNSILEKFKSAGYHTTLIFIFVDDIKSLRDRIDYRYQTKKLHNVPGDVIKDRYDAGLLMLNNTHLDFDNVLIMDNSKHSFDPQLEQLPEAVYIREGKFVEISKTCTKVLLTKISFIKERKKNKGLSF
jgi:predicted ABC-type ATPase